MKLLLHEFRHAPLLWLLLFVPVIFAVHTFSPEAHTALFLLSILAIVPLAALLSRATESVSAKTGDMIGGLLNATLGNLTEFIIGLTALRQGMFELVKASIVGAVVTNALFMLGASFFLGGLRHHVQEYKRETARLQSGLLFLASVALIIPSALSAADRVDLAFTQQLSAGLSVLLIVAYGLGLVFSLGTHRELFASTDSAGVDGEEAWPINVAVVSLGVITVVVALVSEIFVESVQKAAVELGMTPAFVGFIVVALVGAAAEMTSAFAAARKNRLDMSISIALGSGAQITLFIGPALVLLSYAIAPSPLDLRFWPGAVLMLMLSTMTVSLVTNTGKSAWYVGVQLLVVYFIFAMTLYLLPPLAQ